MEEGNTFIPDYSKYSLGELEGIYSRMQKDKFLERVTAIEVEIRNKKIELNKIPTLENLEKAGYYYEYAGFWKRVLATLIDVIIAIVLLPLSNCLLTLSFSSKTILPMLIYDFVFTALIQYYCMMKFGGTPGHLIMKVLTIGDNGYYLNFNRAFLRTLIDLPGIIFSLLQLNYAINNVPTGVEHDNFIKIGFILVQYGGVYTLFAMLFNRIIFIDIIVVLFNKKKRAIHDFIAGSYVVTQDSIGEIEKLKSNLNCA